jgi:hypothetical protein
MRTCHPPHSFEGYITNHLLVSFYKDVWEILIESVCRCTTCISILSLQLRIKVQGASDDADMSVANGGTMP